MKNSGTITLPEGIYCFRNFQKKKQIPPRFRKRKKQKYTENMFLCHSAIHFPASSRFLRSSFPLLFFCTGERKTRWQSPGIPISTILPPTTIQEWKPSWWWVPSPPNRAAQHVRLGGRPQVPACPWGEKRAGPQSQGSDFAACLSLRIKRKEPCVWNH